MKFKRLNFFLLFFVLIVVAISIAMLVNYSHVNMNREQEDDNELSVFIAKLLPYCDSTDIEEKVGDFIAEFVDVEGSRRFEVGEMEDQQANAFFNDIEGLRSGKYRDVKYLDVWVVKPMEHYKGALIVYVDSEEQLMFYKISFTSKWKNLVGDIDKRFGKEIWDMPFSEVSDKLPSIPEEIFVNTQAKRLEIIYPGLIVYIAPDGHIVWSAVL